jgi:hypothetical protein
MNLALLSPLEAQNQVARVPRHGQLTLTHADSHPPRSSDVLGPRIESARDRWNNRWISC